MKNQLTLFDDKQPAAGGLADVSRCSSCDKPIIWLVTKTGKRAPLDTPIRYISPSGKGKRLMLFTDSGETAHGFECKPKDHGAQAGRVSHFATCPNAEQHRR